MAQTDYNATITQRVEIAPGLIILRVVPDSPLFAFQAGQYTVLGLRQGEPRLIGRDPGDASDDPAKLIRRAYSITSSSKAGEYVEFYINIVPSGELTPRLFRLGIRDRLHMGPKATGVFTLNQIPPGKHVLLVGTGTGLAPYMSMLRSELVCNDPRRYVVLQGARYSWDLGYRTELETLARLCRNMHYIPAISRPHEDPSWGGLSGYLQDVLISGQVDRITGLPLTPEVFDVFLCGNPGMIEAARLRLIDRGFVPAKGHATGTIHTEEYW
jgi:ferredoxin/flavodoxin---NADP+ reductase